MKIVEQVDLNGNVIEGYDNSLSKKQIFEKLARYFSNVSFDNGLIVGEYENVRYSILIKNITYLGNPHPTYKKRIQIAGLQEFVNESNKRDYLPLLLGVYSFEDNLIFCDFKIDTYINKKSHNSSAHVYTDDLVCATKEGIFQKEDYFGNTITAFRYDYVNYFLKNKFSDYIISDFSEKEYGEQDYLAFDSYGNFIESPMISEPGITYVANNPKEVLEKIFNDFFSYEPKEWHGIKCYEEMIEDNYRNKFQPEWAGFYLEYEFEKYAKEHNFDVITYYAQDKKDNGIDLDLFFPTINSYGDLKAHSSTSKAVQGNDWKTVMNLLESKDFNNHLYYIVCEHDTCRDKDHKYEVTKFWNKAQNKENEMSYSNKMKNSVKLLKYYVLDINKENKCYLTKFRQGINSDGKLREPKIMIDSDDFDKFMIIEMKFN